MIHYTILKSSFKSSLLALSVIALFASSCKNFTTKEITQGTIEYDISYPNPNEVTMSMDLMPKTVTYHFNKNNTVSEITAGMGALKTMVLTDFEQKKITQTLNLLGKKYKVEFNKALIDSMNEAEPEIKFEVTTETKKIAGYDCLKMKCSTKDSNGALLNYDIYYAPSINVPNVNWFGIYSKVNGMLMEYNVKRYGIHMRFTAKSVSPDGAGDEVFKLEGDYKNISISEMDSYFKMY